MARLTRDALGDVQLALEAGREHLLSLQHEAGWWRGELQTNVTMDAEDLLLREFLGVRSEGETERSAAWIRSQQRADGTWANFFEGPGDLSTTIEAYWALRLAGDDPAETHMQIAAEFIRGQGGLSRARVFTHLWLALFGLWSWDRVPALPVEVVLLPPQVPLNVYDFACWARQTIVAVSVVKTHRPVRRLPFGLEELEPLPGSVPAPEAEAAASERSRRAGMLGLLDRLLRFYEHHPLPPLRRLARSRAESWIVRRQEADGSWGGIQPPWVYSLIALSLEGYPLDHPVMRRGLEGIEGFMVEDRDDMHGVGAPPGASRRLEACQSPVWDTALAMIALNDAGLPGDHPAIVAGARWLLSEEVTVSGDWAVARPGLAPGGWAFEFANDNYPDVDDTAEVILALERLDPDAAPVGTKGAVERALEWTEGMQSSDGGWGAFDADNKRALVRELPFLDFGEVIDEPSADVTAHTVEMLAALGRGGSPVARAGVRWLLEHQERDGSWFGRWGINHVYGTGAAVPGLIAAGMDPAEPAIRRAVRWLERHQNDDGGWGEDARSYDDPHWIGRGPSTASQTAWALLALHAAGERSESLSRGVAWLLGTQRADGGWDEPHYTGTGFPCDYYINYHLYRISFPLMALGRCSAALAETEPEGVAGGSQTPRRGDPEPDDGSEQDRSTAAGRRGGDGPGRRRELPRREPAAARRGPRAPARAVRLSRGSSTSSAMRPRTCPTSASRRSTGSSGELDAAFAGAATHPLMVRLQETIAARSLPRRPFERLIEANRLDQRKARYETWEELRAYCTLSADPVGRAGARRVRREHPGPRRLLRPDLHGPAARRALPGRRRGSRPRTRLPPPRGPRALRLRGARPRRRTRTPGAVCGRRLRGRTRTRADPGGPAARRRSARPPPRGGGGVRGRRDGGPRRDRTGRLRRARRPPPRGLRAPRPGARGGAGIAGGAGAVIDARTQAAYARCEQITREQAANFYWGIRLLSRERRLAMCAAYAFARRVDDIGDGELPVELQLAELAAQDAALAALGRGEADPADPVMLALADARGRFPLPLDALGELVAGVRMDAEDTRYEDFEDLLPYCRRVAGAVGRVCLAIFGVRRSRLGDPAHAYQLADDLGVALQLTNILRDVREDAGLGRVYLPAEDLRRFGLPTAPAELLAALPPAAGADPAAFEGLVAFEAARARDWFDRGLQLTALLDRRSAACVLAMAGIYRRLLEKIDAEPRRALEGRMSLSSAEKARVAARGLIGARA